MNAVEVKSVRFMTISSVLATGGCAIGSTTASKPNTFLFPPGTYFARAETECDGTGRAYSRGDATAVCNDLVSDFERLFAACSGSYPDFHAAVERRGVLDRDKRRAPLKAARRCG
jgi:hypothetical protein